MGIKDNIKAELAAQLKKKKDEAAAKAKDRLNLKKKLANRMKTAAGAIKSRKELITWKNGYLDQRGELYGMTAQEINEIYEKRDRELRNDERKRHAVSSHRDALNRELPGLRDKEAKASRAATDAAGEYTKLAATASHAKASRVRAEGTLGNAKRGGNEAEVRRAERDLEAARRAEKTANDKAGKAKRASDAAERNLRGVKRDLGSMEREISRATRDLEKM